MTDSWASNRIQFARLIAEIKAAGLTSHQMCDLKASMDLTSDDIHELFDRAEEEFESIKRGCLPGTWQRVEDRLPAMDDEETLCGYRLSRPVLIRTADGFVTVAERRQILPYDEEPDPAQWIQLGRDGYTQDDVIEWCDIPK